MSIKSTLIEKIQSSAPSLKDAITNIKSMFGGKKNFTKKSINPKSIKMEFLDRTYSVNKAGLYQLQMIMNDQEIARVNINIRPGEHLSNFKDKTIQQDIIYNIKLETITGFINDQLLGKSDTNITIIKDTLLVDIINAGSYKQYLDKNISTNLFFKL